MDMLTLCIVGLILVAALSLAAYVVRRYLKRRLAEIDGFCGLVSEDEADVINITGEK